ncbi:MAG: hypothetical protein IJ991_16710 [Thermoguttaceae bacterium]|nr:hypothetical protein [Thermoguttaceae bacterium]
MGKKNGCWRLNVAVAAALLWTNAAVRAETTIYPAPQGEAVEGAYVVKVDGKPLDIYSAQDQEAGSGEYYFTSFDFDDKVKIEISAPFSLVGATVAPERFGVKVVEQTAETTILEADKPFQISFEPNKRVKPLLIFGNAPEIDAPKPGDANVVYFGPGVHRPGKIELTDGQTLYLAGGAVVKGAVLARGKNIVVRGRGILAGEESPRFNGPGRFMLDCVDCENLTVRDITFRNPWSWTFVLWNCDGATIDGVKICGSRMINDDALDLVNSSNIIVKNCFFRTQDDSIAVKGMIAGGPACENIAVEDCVFWTDRANIFRVGYECECEGMRVICAKNIDILYYSVNYRDPSEYWANALIWLQPNQKMTMEDCRFENFNVRADGGDIIALMAKPMSCSYGAFENPTPGRLTNCSFVNFNVWGEKGDFNGMIFVKGASETSDVDGLRFEKIVYFGEKIGKDAGCVRIEDFAENIEFAEKTE